MAVVAVVVMVLGDIFLDIVERGLPIVVVGITMGSITAVDFRLDLVKQRLWPLSGKGVPLAARLTSC